MRDLIIIGAGDVGGFIAYHFAESTQYRIVGFLDEERKKWGKSYKNFPIFGDWTYLKNSNEFAVAIGIANPIDKRKMWENIKDITGLEFPNLIHTNSWIGENVSLGKGVIIYPGTMINYETKIGDFVTINMNCAIGHNCNIESFGTISPGVNLGGFTHLGKSCFIGIGANTIQSTEIGSQCTIGGGSMIIKDVPDGCTVVGNPGKIIKRTHL
jgi:sugar O-acyltransferase (sialic acid O-acetyltransferase NeuD family)